MRKKGSIFVLEEQRNRDLLRAYREVITRQLDTEGKIGNMGQVLMKVVNSPASRYWVSTDRACSVIYRMNKGQTINWTKDNKRIFYDSLYREFLKYKEANPCMPIKHIIEIIVLKSAPCFPLSPRVAGFMIHKTKKKCYEETLQRLRHLF